jgi:curved DNA-binding protein CbpA
VHTVFVNFYEALELEPTARRRDVERSFRLLARRFHPDNQATGDRERFDAIVAAHRILGDDARRAKYHAENFDHLPPLQFADDAAADAAEGAAAGANGQESAFDALGIENDVWVQNHILTLLYQRRRLNTKEPGIGDAELEDMAFCPPEHLEFHMWYLKAKGWIAKGEDGLLAITIHGVDRAAEIHRDGTARLITDQT